MVTPNWSAPPRPPKLNFVPAPSTADNSLLARPLDRLAAVIVDFFVVLAPVYYLLSSPFRNWMTASFLMSSWVWVGQVLCLGLPLPAVFSNNKRRPLHDRVCDTVVISTSQSGVVGPTRWEQGLVRGVFGLV